MCSLRTVPFGAALMLSAASLTAATLPAAPGDPSRHFTVSPLLQASVRTVWQASPEVAMARAELDAARARARAAAQPVYNPTVSFDAENADVDRRTAGVSLALDFSGKRRARADAGEAQVRAGEATFESVRRDVGSRWLKAWATAALATRKVELGQHRVDLMKRFDDLASERLTAGDISGPERDLAALALGESQMQQATLTGQQGAARATLQAISGEATMTVPPLPDGVLPATNGFDAQSVDELPELREARARIDVADASVRVAERARVPDPTVSLTGGQVSKGPLNDRVVGVNVSIPLPVFNSGRAEVDAARADADAASASLQARRLILRVAQHETRARYTALQSASDALRSGRVAAFDERAGLLEKLWRAGEIGTSDYLVQLKQNLDTALSGVELQSQAWLAWFDCLAAGGRLVDWIDGRNAEAAP